MVKGAVALQLDLSEPVTALPCSHAPCRRPITRSGMCDTHRGQIDPAYLARFDAAWDNKDREDWFKLTGHLYAVWWAHDRGEAIPAAPNRTDG